MRRVRAYFLILLATLSAAGCQGVDPPFAGTFDRVLIFCNLGYNNLSDDILHNIDELADGVLPGLSYDKAIVIFSHSTVGGSYKTPNPPVLVRLYRGGDGRPVFDTLKTYGTMAVSASASSIRTVLEDIRDAFPARNYGMVFSSHATGWLPADYDSRSERSVALHREADPDRAWPRTKALGAQSDGSRTRWVELPDFAAAIPMRLEYMILDCCLSGAVEVAWELKDVCDRLVVTPAEILSAGMRYKNLSRQLFSGAEPDLEAFCRETFEYYDAQSGSGRSVTLSMVDCTRLEALAEAFSAVLDARRDALSAASLRNTVQRYFYGSTRLRFFYDLRDLAVQLGATGDELDRLDAALADCIPYHAETPSFFDLPLERCCGLSVYIPEPARPSLNAFYRTLAWNRRVGLL